MSALVDKHKINAVQFYQWQKLLFEVCHGRAVAGAHRTKKRTWGSLTQRWVPHDVRDQVVDTIRSWSEKTELPLRDILGWADIHSSTLNKWIRCYGNAYEHNGKVPRDHWLTDQEKQAVIQYQFDHPLKGYRRLTYMMMDANIVACSPSTLHRLLSPAGLLQRFSKRPNIGAFVQR